MQELKGNSEVTSLIVLPLVGKRICLISICSARSPLCLSKKILWLPPLILFRFRTKHGFTARNVFLTANQDLLAPWMSLQGVSLCHTSHQGLLYPSVLLTECFSFALQQLGGEEASGVTHFDRCSTVGCDVRIPSGEQLVFHDVNIVSPINY